MILAGILMEGRGQVQRLDVSSVRVRKSARLYRMTPRGLGLGLQMGTDCGGRHAGGACRWLYRLRLPGERKKTTWSENL
jgi:hypothetical protein